MPARYRKYLEFAALLLLAVGIIWWFGRRLDWQQVKAALANCDLRLILFAALLVLAGYLGRALRWQAFLAPLTKASLKEVWIATTVGFGAVLLIGRAGEIVRPVVLPMRDPRVRPAASFVTIMIERLYDSITVLLLFAINFFWFTPAAGTVSDLTRMRVIGIFFFTAPVVAVTLLICFRRRSKSVIQWTEKKFHVRSRLGERIKRAVVNTMEQLAIALGVLSNRRELAITVGWSLLLWSSVAAGNLVVFRAFGLPFGISHALFVLGWSMIGSAIPTPGGAAGAFHAVTGAALVMMGVAREQAAAVAIVLHLVDFAPAAVFGFFYFLRGDINVTRLRALISTKAVEHVVEDEKLAPPSGAKELEVVTANE